MFAVYNIKRGKAVTEGVTLVAFAGGGRNLQLSVQEVLKTKNQKSYKTRQAGGGWRSM